MRREGEYEEGVNKFTRKVEKGTSKVGPVVGETSAHNGGLLPVHEANKRSSDMPEALGRKRKLG